MSKTESTSRGFIGYRKAMQFQGLDRELFNMYMMISRQDQLDNQARIRFGYQEVKFRKFKPMVYGKSTD